MTDTPASAPAPTPDPDPAPGSPPAAHPSSLPGSRRAPVAGATVSGPVPAGDPVTVTLVLRRRAEFDVAALSGPLDRTELAERFGADPADLDAVTGWAASAGLRVDLADAASRRVRLSGDVATVTRAFGTDVERAEVGGVTFRQRRGELRLPPELAGPVTAVLGLDDRPQARSRRAVVARAEVSTSFTPPELGALYDFPPGDGHGQTVAVIELGGGYRDSELASYWGRVGLGATRPTVTAVGVDGAANTPSSDPSGADGEVLLDVEVVGALVPGADVVVYFAPNTDAGFLDAVTAAAHAQPTPAAMSISWGQSEDQWTAQARTAMDAAFADACALGVTVTVAAGDDGSSDRQTDGGVHADFPASSPHVLACGGTSLHASGGRPTHETVWNNGTGNGATGGGVSAAFARPSWQAQVTVPPRAGTTGTTHRDGRGVPDVAAVADPRTGYQVLVDGQDTVIGGTSAVAPLWAALVARLVQQLGHPLGLAQPALYRGAGATSVPPGFRDVTEGDNGAYRATPGWDACTGLGVPVGTALLTALQQAAPAAPAASPDRP